MRRPTYQQARASGLVSKSKPEFCWRPQTWESPSLFHHWGEELARMPYHPKTAQWPAPEVNTLGKHDRATVSDYSPSRPQLPVKQKVVIALFLHQTTGLWTGGQAHEKPKKLARKYFHTHNNFSRRMWRTDTAASVALLGRPVLREPSFRVPSAKLEVSEEEKKKVKRTISNELTPTCLPE